MRPDRSPAPAGADAAVGSPISAFVARYALVVFVAVAFVNSQVGRIVQSVSKQGVVAALGGTFGTSAVVWLGMVLTLSLLHRSGLRPASGLDLAVLAVASLLVAYPVPETAWVGLTLLGAHLLLAHGRDPAVRESAVLLLAVCFSGLWSRLLSRLLLDHILRFDTFLIGTLTGSPFEENVIVAADGVTVFKVMEGCSSFENLSLAFLAWMIGRAYYGTSGLARSAAFVLLSAATVIAINTARIGIMVLRPDWFSLAHGPVGEGIAGLLTSLAVLSITVAGARR